MKIIFDTNITDLLGQAYRDDAETIMAAIARRFTVVATSETFCEILDGMCKGDSDHFELHKARFKVMVGNGLPRFLRLPAEFALRTILKLESPLTKIKPTELLRGYYCIRFANSRDDLFTGKVIFPGPKKRQCGFKPDYFVEKHDEGKKQHLAWLKRIQDGTETLGSPVVWAGSYVGQQLGHILDLNQMQAFADGLDAVYHYASSLCQMVKNQNYNFDEHSGDWVDLHQLYFLSDPNIHLLTDDSRLKKRIYGSSQYDRVLLFRDLLQRNGFTLRH